MSENPLELAGASQEPDQPEANFETAREIFPVRFEKDYKDFRTTAQADDEVVAPKSSSAPASVAQPASPMGLEDVSAEDLENPALPDAEKDKTPTPSKQDENGSSTSSAATSLGKTGQPAAK